MPGPDRFAPWPIARLLERLSSGDLLQRLVMPRVTAGGRRDVRESLLEQALVDECVGAFGRGAVSARRPVGATLGLPGGFPSRCMPDVTLQAADGTHLCEVKSSRTDYARFDNVFDSKGFREWLAARGHAGAPPWEVEQDLLKLRLFGELSGRVRSGLLVFVDAYAGPGPSWAGAFGDAASLRATMRTNIVKEWTPDLIAGTTIFPIEADGARARLIACAAYRAR